MTKEVENAIVNAFAVIHSLNVIHNDIRAENILVQNGGERVWIIDFEFARIVGPEGEELKTVENRDIENLIKKIKSSPSKMEKLAELKKSKFVSNGNGGA